MARYHCISCGAQYDDKMPNGALYLHACPPTMIITHAVCDQTTGEVITPAKYGPTPNPRNENIRPDLQYHEGKPVLVSRDPNDATRLTIVPADCFIIAEGNGRALAVAGQVFPCEAMPQPTIPGA